MAEGEEHLMNEEEQIDQIPKWIGFDKVEQHNALLKNFATFDDIGEMTNKDVNIMSENFSRRPTAAKRFHIGITCAKRLKNLIHWC